ncbi:MAG: lysoplasmalogenase [Bacilli bacterium]|nr:lysoplasmalogenase [Bacilli bacterium]
MDWSRIPIVSFVFFGIFLLVSLVHLVFCFLELELPRKITKGFTTMMLGIGIVCAIPTEPLPYIGLFLGMAGDFSLLKKHKVWPFVLGLVLFLVGHIVYIIEYVRLCAPVHWGVIAGIVVYAVLSPFIFGQISRRVVHQKKLVVGGAFYLDVLSLALIVPIIACCLGKVDYLLLCVFGALSFLLSDVILTITMFKKDIRRRDFYIMFTYLLAQALIGIGFVFTVLMG